MQTTNLVEWKTFLFNMEIWFSAQMSQFFNKKKQNQWGMQCDGRRVGGVADISTAIKRKKIDSAEETFYIELRY